MKHRGIAYGASTLLIVTAAVGVLIWMLVQHGFSAKDKPTAAEAYVARTVRRLSVPRGEREAKNPVEESPAVLSQAMEHFADHCAICHGNDGKGNTRMGKGLYPKAPDMTLDATQQLTDGELYYIIENGVRLTGMPAFGEDTGDAPNEESWALVHFIRHLPKLTAEEIQTMKTMNPKSPAELAREEKLRRFLEGDDTSLPETNHVHHQ